MNEALKQELSYFLEHYQQWLSDFTLKKRNDPDIPSVLLESVIYSLNLPGKRFRPFLAFLSWKAFTEESRRIDEVLSWCLAVEFIHTYSLIHDDLPCMDNDDFRRGQPSNHKVYGEDIALLAGDALLTEAFRIISEDQQLAESKKIKLIQLLSLKTGAAGMVGGQVLDMKSQLGLTEEQLKKIHNLKTGYLIQTSAMGGAIIAGASQAQIESISKYSLHLGLAFQIKDDLLDGNDSDQDHKSYLTAFGEEKTKDYLQQTSAMARASLEEIKTSHLISLIEHNTSRET